MLLTSTVLFEMEDFENREYFMESAGVILAYGIYARVVDESEIERVSTANE